VKLALDANRYTDLRRGNVSVVEAVELADESGCPSLCWEDCAPDLLRADLLWAVPGRATKSLRRARPSDALFSSRPSRRFFALFAVKRFGFLLSGF
jgi:hypothetical protein